MRDAGAHDKLGHSGELSLADIAPRTTVALADRPAVVTADDVGDLNHERSQRRFRIARVERVLQPEFDLRDSFWHFSVKMKSCSTSVLPTERLRKNQMARAAHVNTVTADHVGLASGFALPSPVAMYESSGCDTPMAPRPPAVRLAYTKSRYARPSQVWFSLSARTQ